MKKHLFLLILLFAFATSSYAQISPSLEEKARKELDRKGLNDEEVRKRLAAKGVDLDNIDPNNPTDILKAEKSLKEVMDELSAEKAKSSVSSKTAAIDTLDDEGKAIIARQAEEVSESIDDGASLEEAVSETLIDNQIDKLPEAKIYGQELFRSQRIKLYRKSQDIKPPGSYVLGVDDKIGVSIWGNSQESKVYTINEEGFIKPQGMPRIYLKGLTLEAIRDLLRKRFGNYYNFEASEFEVTVVFSRNINVNIVGEVNNYGSFNIPAINSAFNALVAGGGPNDIGSVRNILLMRAGTPNKNIDVYKYLLKPSISNDFYLEENDIIYVPVAEKLVSIQGGIKRPFIYELLPSENLKELIEFAGGFSKNAVKSKIQLIRTTDGVQEITDIDFNTSPSVKLQGGDKILVKSLIEKYKNFVSVKGAVTIEDDYAISDNDRVSDLLEKIDIKDFAMLSLAYLKRYKADGKSIEYLPINLAEIIENKDSKDNVLLKSRDQLRIYSEKNYTDAANFTVKGAVRTPGSFEYSNGQGLKINDAIFFAGGVKTDSEGFAYLKRKNFDKVKQSEIIRVDLLDALNNVGGTNNINIMPYDTLYVYSKEQFADNLFVTVAGEVRKTGRYDYDESLTIRNLLYLSEGVKMAADLNRVDVYRIDFSDNKETRVLRATIKIDSSYNVIGNDNFVLRPFDEIFIRKAPEFELQRRVRLRGEVKYPGYYVIMDDNETFSQLIERAGGLTEEAFIGGVKLYRDWNGKGFIISDFEKAMKNPNSFNDITLFEGDDVIIPKLENLVTIIGETRAAYTYPSVVANSKKINVPFEKGKNALYYIDKYAGGVGDTGNKSDIRVTDQSGRVKGTNRFLFWRNYPEVEKGSIISVAPKPVKEEKNNSDKKQIDWDNVLSNAVAQATSILTLLLLIDRLD